MKHYGFDDPETRDRMVKKFVSLGIAAVGTVLFDRLGNGHGAASFIGAADHALLVAVGFLVAACAAVFWLPKHARRAH